MNLQEARASIVTELAAVCRSMGADRTLVLGGGGNASVKTVVTDITDATVPVLFVKASGHDLATITADGFAPLRLTGCVGCCHR